MGEGVAERPGSKQAHKQEGWKESRADTKKAGSEMETDAPQWGISKSLHGFVGSKRMPGAKAPTSGNERARWS